MSNPLLSKVKLPGRIFQLPSKGLFYDSSVLADHVKNGEIEVRPLSAFAEIKLRSADMLFSGRAIREVCLECIPDILIPEKLISKDVDAIFCFLRIVTYGSVMKIKSVHCQKHSVHTYKINVEDIISNANNQILDNIDLLFNYNLSTDQTIELKPVTFQDALETTHLQAAIHKNFLAGENVQELIETTMTEDVLSVIKNVDGISDKKQIKEWIASLQRTVFDEIIERAKESSEWGYNLQVDLTCKDCNTIYKHDLELNPINFFSG